MAIRPILRRCAILAAALLSGCGDPASGPIAISAIGGPPRVVNPNLDALDPPAAFLLSATAQGLVRFDATGQVEPALAQSWIVSDDGLRYTFRLARVRRLDGEPITARQVVARLRAAISTASRNPLKPVLGAITTVEPMTDDVLEFALAAPRPNFLQLLAQPQMAILIDGVGTGPYRPAPAGDGSIMLALPVEEDEDPRDRPPDIVLRGEPASRAVARFVAGKADAVIGGTLGDLPIAAASNPRARTFRFDPVSGLFGLAFLDRDGPFSDPAVRRALSMAVDRAAIVTAIGVPDLAARQTLLPTGIAELPRPAAPDWAATPIAARRAGAANTISAASGGAPLRIRVGMPDGFGYRVLFAHLRRDWSLIGVEAERVPRNAAADVVLVDQVAPSTLPTWYLRHFLCGTGRACVADVDPIMAAARATQDMAERRTLLAAADRLLTDAAVFIPITTPVRWSLVAPRLTGFQPNPFAKRSAGSLIASRP